MALFSEPVPRLPEVPAQMSPLKKVFLSDQQSRKKVPTVKEKGISKNTVGQRSSILEGLLGALAVGDKLGKTKSLKSVPGFDMMCLV